MPPGSTSRPGRKDLHAPSNPRFCLLSPVGVVDSAALLACRPLPAMPRWRIGGSPTVGGVFSCADRFLPCRQERLRPPDHVGIVLGQGPHVGGPRLQLAAVEGRRGAAAPTP